MSVTNDMQNARRILKTKGLRNCANQICEAFSLTTATDLANLSDAEIDTQTFIIYTFRVMSAAAATKKKPAKVRLSPLVDSPTKTRLRKQ
jgi:hypothetical protein